MKTSRKQELKGAFKAIVAIFVVGMAIGVGYATVVITDEGVWVDNNKVLVEGDYTTWTLLWESNITAEGIYDPGYVGIHINEINDKIYYSWYDDAATTDDRFAITNLADNSIVYASSAGSSYVYSAADPYDEGGLARSTVGFLGGGASLSLHTYILIMRNDMDTMEVWRGDSSALWSRDITNDGATSSYAECGIISSTGKYIIIASKSATTGKNALFCYEGS